MSWRFLDHNTQREGGKIPGREAEMSSAVLAWKSSREADVLGSSSSSAMDLLGHIFA